MIGALIGAAGIGLSLFGSSKASKAAKQAAEAQKMIIQQEQRAEAVRKQAMELDARRRSLELVRQQQRVRAMALATASNQGAQFGSAFGGAQGQISGQTSFNLLGVSQNLGFGQQLFDINATKAQYQMQLADAQSKSSTAQGITSLGGSVLNVMSPLSNILGNYTGTSTQTSGMSGNSLLGFNPFNKTGSLY